MWSGPQNNKYLSKEAFNKIILDADERFNESYQIQLGGGEPTLHPQLLEFVEFSCNQPLIQSIVIDTNGVVLDNLLPSLFRLSQTYQKRIVLKVSINYYLIEQNPTYLNQIQNWIEDYPKSDLWLICLSIRVRTPQSLDALWLEKLRSFRYFNCAYNYHTIECTGRADKNKLLGTVYSHAITPRNCEPIVYACDGKCFGRDFDARMNYEKTLSIDL